MKPGSIWLQPKPIHNTARVALDAVKSGQSVRVADLDVVDEILRLAREEGIDWDLTFRDETRYLSGAIVQELRDGGSDILGHDLPPGIEPRVHRAVSP